MQPYSLLHNSHNLGPCRQNPLYGIFMTIQSRLSWIVSVFTYITSNIYLCLHIEDVETVRKIIKGTLLIAIELFVPKVRIRTRRYPKWFTSQLIHEANCLHTLRKKYNHSPTDHNLNRLRNITNYKELPTSVVLNDIQASVDHHKYICIYIDAESVFQLISGRLQSPITTELSFANSVG